MSRKLSATQLFEDVEVDLWGNAYTLRTMTKTVVAALDKAQTALDNLPDDATNDKLVAAMITVLDVSLEPVADAPTVKVLLSGLWKEDKLGLDWLHAFLDALGDEAIARRRPTSAPRTGA